MDVGDVSNELAPGTIGGEVPFHQVGHVRRSHRIGLRCDPEWPWVAGHEAFLAHHLPNQLGGTLRLLRGQVGVDSAIPVSPIRLLEIVSDPHQKGLTAG